MRGFIGKTLIIAALFVMLASGAVMGQDGRCCFGNVNNPDCQVTDQATCEGKTNFISWTEGEACATPCAPRDTVMVQLVYSVTDFQYYLLPDSTVADTLTVEVWFTSNANLSASQIGFAPNRHLFTLSDVEWDESNIGDGADFNQIKGDTAVLGFSWFGTGDIFFAATDVPKRAATFKLTYIADSLDAIIDVKQQFFYDSTFYGDAGTFLLTHQDGVSVFPLLENDTIQLGISKVTDINPGIIPAKFELGQNYPNPFNPTTNIEFAVPLRSHVKLNVYNVMGQKVRTLVNEELDAGWKLITWDGKSDSGNEVGSGVYLYRVKAGDFIESKKMMLVK